MISLAWRSLVSRRLAVLAALMAVVVGSALVTAALLVFAAQREAGGAASVSSWRFGGVDAVVEPPDRVRLGTSESLNLLTMPRLTQEQQDAVVATDGVASVAFETPFPAYAVADDGRVIGDALARSWGHPWSTAAADGADLVDGERPSSGNEVAIDRAVAEEAGVSVGDRLRVQLSAGLRTFVVSGIVERAGGQFEKALFFTAPVVFGEGGKPVLALVRFDGSGSVGALRSAVPDLRVLTGAEKATALQLDLNQAELAAGSGNFFGFVAFLALTLAVLVVSSTLSVSVQQRRKEIAMLRIVGARPSLMRRMVVWEGLFVGLFGGAAGCLAGVLLAHLATRFFIAQNIMARATVVAVAPEPLLAGLLAGAATALLAAWIPAGRATKIPPLEALTFAEMQPATQPVWRTGMGWVLLGTAVACVAVSLLVGGPILTPRGMAAGLLLFATLPMFLGASALLGPQLLHLILDLLERVLRRWLPGFVAERSIRSDLRRAAGVSVPLTLLVAASCFIPFQERANHQNASRGYAQYLTADVVVSDGRQFGSRQLGVPMNTAAVVEDVPGVAAASATVRSELIVDQHRASTPTATATGVDPASFTKVLDYDVTGGSWKGFGDGGIAVSGEGARSMGWDVGDRVEFRYPDGSPGVATVTTIYREPVGLGSREVTVPIETLTPRLVESFPTAVYVALEPGADQRETLAAIDRALDASAPGTAAVSRDRHLADEGEQAGVDWSVLTVIIVLGGYAAVSAINVLAGSTMSRKREFALLRLAGAHKKQVVASLFAETLVVATTAVLAGTAIVAVITTGYTYLISDGIWPPFAWPTYAVVVACAYLAAFVGTLAPAQAALKAAPLDAAR